MTLAVELAFFKQCVNQKSVLISHFSNDDKSLLNKLDVSLEHDKNRVFVFNKNENMYYWFLSLNDISSDTLILRHEDEECARVPLSAISNSDGYSVNAYRKDSNHNADSIFVMEIIPDENIQIVGRRNNHGINTVSFGNTSFYGRKTKSLRYNLNLQAEKAYLIGFGVYSIPHPKMVRKLMVLLSVVDNQLDGSKSDENNAYCVKIDYDCRKQTGDKYEY